MIVQHIDADGDKWFFRIDGTINVIVARLKKLERAAARVRLAREHVSKGAGRSELSRAKLAEAVALSDFQAYHPATLEDWSSAAENDRFPRG